MGLFDRIKRVVSSNLNDLVNKAEDPEKMLEQAILEMQEDLVQLRQGVAQAIAAQKRTETQYNDTQNQINKWQRNAQLALQKGDENLARQALERKKSFSDTSVALKTSLDQQTTQTETLKRNLVQLESKISEAKTKKEMLKARITSAKAQEKLETMVRGMSTSSAMAAFERMEEKVLMQEARAQAGAELAGADLETQFARLESSDVDYELEELKRQMLPPAAAPNQPQISPKQDSSTAKSNDVVDADLEVLKRQLDQM
ncbi:PspA/IM30 family protein [Anabaenopsis elenkinii]|uniref:PspA/IM30 family protein n=1 Tax=Anabaenopsis elenkinii CCIBt3563 TaxID=2779889 RepID=A0A7S6RDM2_9CYAN|nr:PspA/IM30 family protein [Anabaenopsis elenkinii]QOV23002.1 PspA/IM30 family protein [Anabaenopsis elenkinii CCIBt3563]